MARFKSFEEIKAWQKARILTKTIYQITERETFSKDFDLIRQIRRCSVSITSNIAEGFERQTEKEFRQFLFIAKGSAGELRSQLYLTFDLGYISNKEFENLKGDVVEVSKMISGLIKHL